MTYVLQKASLISAARAKKLVKNVAKVNLHVNAPWVWESIIQLLDGVGAYNENVASLRGYVINTISKLNYVFAYGQSTGGPAHDFANERAADRYRILVILTTLTIQADSADPEIIYTKPIVPWLDYPQLLANLRKITLSKRILKLCEMVNFLNYINQFLKLKIPYKVIICPLIE
ncbi:hypothetical protein An06g02250 [Aspergillus niger]|uniref:Uncharacterized protein n=2 Tax=Aspergillus niger TaxID=5061 RepID=A2QLS3_ASPNC|nr:hypothetical protein An06g02250 [Aspergillus niger]CAK48068.1 hypothetical protein An06g02250 [Aspergillus niger]